MTDPGGTSTFAYDDGGRPTEIATPDGSTRSLTYDAASNVTQVKNITSSGTQTLGYSYDANGNMLSEGSTTYTYDALNRLASWYDPTANETTTYAYDAVGNPTQVQVGGTTTKSFTYNAANEITNTGYTYDDNGNLTSDGTHTYVYDGENQLVQVKSGDTVIASMTYDYNGNRTSLTTSAGTTYFHYANSVLTAESDSSGNITATYNYTPDGSLISMTRGGSTYYYQTNAHGDVVSLTDSTGAVVATYSYDPWGSTMGSTGTVPNPLRYAGYYYDGSTGLYYNWHRYYDPATMRFISADPAYRLTFDRYGYCGDNPTNMGDKTGLENIVLRGLDYANTHWNPIGMAIDTRVGNFLDNPSYDSFNENLNLMYPAVVQYGNAYDEFCAGCYLDAYKDYVEGNFDTAMVGLAVAGGVDAVWGVSGSGGAAAADAAALPPGWDDSWEWRGCSRESEPGKSWWDSEGGEWRLDPRTNKYHEPHWDYNPWSHATDEWQNIPLGE
jgi:RHS repeat-associated protein